MATLSPARQRLFRVVTVVLALVLSWLISGFFGIQQEIAALARSLH